jgi:hypothetical protein
MSYAGILVVFIILIALLFGALVLPFLLLRERPGTPSAREKYSPMPSKYRALEQLGAPGHGWAEYPPEFHATTASAVARNIERSA